MRNKNKQLLIANVHPLRLCSTILFQISKVLLIRPFPAEREKNKLWGSWERKYNCAYTNGWHVIFAHVTDLRIKCYARISPHFFNKVLNWRPFPAIDEKTKIPTPSFFRKIRTRRFRYLIFSQQTLHGCRNDLPLNSHVLSTSSVLRNFSWRGSFSAIWWSFVFGVRFLWRQSLTPYSCVQTNVLAKFVDMICIFFYSSWYTWYAYFFAYSSTRTLNLYVMALNIYYQLSRLDIGGNKLKWFYHFWLCTTTPGHIHIH